MLAPGIVILVASALCKPPVLVQLTFLGIPPSAPVKPDALVYPTLI